MKGTARFASLALGWLLVAASAGPVAAVSTTTLVVEADPTGMVGVGLSLTATLTSGASGLTIQPVHLLIDGSTWVTPNTGAGGVLARSYKFTTPGEHTISAHFDGTASYAPAAGNVVTVSIEAAPTITISPDAYVVELGGAPGLTTTISPNDGGFVRWVGLPQQNQEDFAVTPVDADGHATFMPGPGDGWAGVGCDGKTFFAGWSPDGTGAVASTSVFVSSTWPVTLGVEVAPGPYSTALVAGVTARISITASPLAACGSSDPRVFDGEYTLYDTVNGERSAIGTASTVATAIGTRFVAGDHLLELFYPGNGAYSPALASTEFTVLPDGSVDATGVGLSTSTFYPYKDGYRDTVAIKGTRGETIAVSARIYDSSNHLVRTLWASSGAGPYSITWNGRTSGGSQVAAGRYRVTQTLKDAAGHTLLVSKFVNVSAKRLYWHSKTVTKYGSSYCCTQVDGGELSTHDSAYYRGLLVDGNQYGDSATVSWAFTLEPATKYGSLTFKVLGRSAPGRGSVKVFFNRYVPSDYGPMVTAGRSYGWYSTKVSPTGYYTSARHVVGMLYASGVNLGAFDVSKVSLVYRYALLR